MTEPEHLGESPPLPNAVDSAVDTAVQLDTTVGLLTRITAQLGTQLSHVRLNGSRTPCVRPIGPPSSPSPTAAATLAR